MPIEWRDEISVGDAFVDDDHKRLIDVVNAYEAAVAEQDPAGLKAAFEALAAYTEEHFEREENLMAAVHFKGINEHRLLHQELYEQIHEIHENILEQRKGAIDLAETNSILHDWIVVHILQEDMKLKPYLTGQRGDTEDREKLGVGRDEVYL